MTKAELQIMTREEVIIWAEENGVTIKNQDKVKKDQVIKLCGFFKKLTV